jgi:murein DD-endopeptidase MepM/ murein hydrolase activator NlpD
MAKCAAAALIAALMCFGSIGDAMADSISDLRAKRKNLDQSVSDAKRQLNSTVSDRNNTAYEADVLDAEMENAQMYYDYYVDLLAWADAELVILEADLAQAMQDYDVQYAAFVEHIRLINEAGGESQLFLKILMGSGDINELVNNAEYAKELMEYDARMTEQLLVKKDEIGQKLASVEEYRLEIEAMRYEQEGYLAQLNQKILEKEARLTALYEQEAYFNQMIADIQADEKKVENLIKEAEAAELARQRAALGENAVKTPYQGGVLAWPVPSSTNITSGYGNRKHPISKKNDFHGAIDIGAKSGNSITAAGNGKVIFAARQGSYGNLIIVDHGGGISTAYAHCSSFVASVGQTVTKGQVIAKIGSTGQSTGPHLHFEVRVDGSQKNPIDYLKG